MARGRRRVADDAGDGSRPSSAAAPREEELFFPDDETSPRAKNDRLAHVLSTAVNPLAVLSIRRLEIGGTGWLITHRTVMLRD